MPIFKIKKNSNYTVMSNYHLKGKDLSYKAKGLLSFMLSLPEDWNYSLASLCFISKETRNGCQLRTKNIRKTLNDNVKYYRFKNRYTQEELAEKCDLSPRYLSNIEN